MPLHTCIVFSFVVQLMIPMHVLVWWVLYGILSCYYVIVFITLHIRSVELIGENEYCYKSYEYTPKFCIQLFEKLHSYPSVFFSIKPYIWLIFRNPRDQLLIHHYIGFALSLSENHNACLTFILTFYLRAVQEAILYISKLWYV